jgi:hypothetical protein
MPAAFHPAAAGQQPSLSEISPRSVIEFELALFCHALKCFAGIFDPVLVIVTVGRQQLDDLIGAARARTAYGARSVQYRLANAKFVRPQQRRAYRNLAGPRRGRSTQIAAAIRLRLAGNLPRNRLTNAGSITLH